MQTKTNHIFALFGTSEPSKLDAAVERAFAERSYQIATGQWLVCSDTAQPAKIFEALLDDEQQQITCVIIMMAGYYGRQNKAIWDWIEVNQNGE